MNLLESWRWYGPNDPVSLSDIEQTGAIGIVHALHHVPVGETWSMDEINARKKSIQWDDEENRDRNLKWVVVESLNVHESIKKGTPDRDEWIDKYKKSLENLAACGIPIVCYNFMPVLDWTRTSLDFRYHDGSKALRYDVNALAAFELFILKREGAFTEYPDELVQKAKDYFDGLSDEERNTLEHNILQGVPGSGDVFTLEHFKDLLLGYRDVNEQTLRANLAYFLERVIPTAEQLGIKLCCHPDDPPIPLFGLPRIVSTEDDLRRLVNTPASPSNGITFCTGSLGPTEDNDAVQIIKNLGSHIHFIHLRNIRRENDGSFHESDHLDGSVDMYGVVKALLEESNQRAESGREDVIIPFRPDHGHQMLDDLHKKVTFHGYSAIGRMRGLAELRGLILGIKGST
ncbi:MAG: mannonate dehydratase [Bacteroidota bacterium]